MTEQHQKKNGGQDIPRTKQIIRKNTPLELRKEIWLGKLKENREDRGSFYNYGQFIYTHSQTPSTIICPIHGPFQQSPRNHLIGQGCPTCADIKQSERLKGSLKINHEEFLRRSYEAHGHLYEYPEEYGGCLTKIKIICKDHGPFLQLPTNHWEGNGCPKCFEERKESKGVSQIKEYLRSHSIEFDTEVKFDTCFHIRLLPFDFYLPEYNLLIEYDGIQHEKGWGNKKKKLYEKQRNDQIKNDWARENNIPLLRINYNEAIEEKLEEIQKTYDRTTPEEEWWSQYSPQAY